jgi:Spy/CpxP family protein refolding chaperone
MWNNLRKPLLALSLGLNAAFIAVWLAHSVPGLITGQRASKEIAEHAAVSSTFHREIGVTPEQWEQIEPYIRQFRENTRGQRQTMGSLRGELLELLAAPVLDEKAIRSKQEEILAGQRRMQNLVIEHLLREREILSPNQVERLMQALCEQCRHQGGMAVGRGLGRVLDEQSFNDGSMEKEKLE